MRRFPQLYLSYLRLSMQSLLVYRTDALVGGVGFLLANGALLFTLFLIFDLVDAIGGWSFWEVLFLYSFVSLSRACWDTFMHNMITLSSKVRDGSFDRLMLRPVDPLFQLLAEKLDPDTVGELIFSLILVVITMSHFQLLADPVSVGLFFLLVISSTLCFASLHLVVNTTAFWAVETSALSFILWRLDETTRYPLSIYPTWLKHFLTWIVPYGFVGYYPVQWFVGKGENPVIWLAPFVGPLLFALAYGLWRVGLSHYQSTGS